MENGGSFRRIFDPNGSPRFLDNDRSTLATKIATTDFHTNRFQKIDSQTIHIYSIRKHFSAAPSLRIILRWLFSLCFVTRLIFIFFFFFGTMTTRRSLFRIFSLVSCAANGQTDTTIGPRIRSL